MEEQNKVLFVVMIMALLFAVAVHKSIVNANRRAIYEKTIESKPRDVPTSLELNTLKYRYNVIKFFLFLSSLLNIIQWLSSYY